MSSASERAALTRFLKAIHAEIGAMGDRTRRAMLPGGRLPTRSGGTGTSQGAEPPLGAPLVDGDALVSTTAGARSWATLATGAALAAHLADTSDAHDASAISFVPTGTIAATDVQAALAEVAAEAVGLPAGGGLGQLLTKESATDGDAAWRDPAPLFDAEPPGLNLVSRGVVLAPGGSGAWDGTTYVESPAIFLAPATQKYGMVYTGYDGTERIGLAWSTDLLHWTKDAANPILSPTGVGGDPDQGGVTGAYVVVEGGVTYLFYIGATGGGIEGGTTRLCLASGPDLYHLTRHGAIIAPTSGWRSTMIYHPSIIKVGGTYYLFFNAKGGHESIGYATASGLLGPWTVDDANSPVLDTGGGWDSGIVGDPAVWHANGVYYLAYFGFNGGAAGDGLAYTTEANFPLGWVKYAGNPLLAPGFGGGIDTLYAHKPFIYRTPGCHYHYYTADNGSVRQIALATETVPVLAATLTHAGVADWDEAVQDTVGAMLTDSAELDFIYSDTPGTETAVLKTTTVTPGSYTYAALTVDSKGRLTAASSGAPPISETFGVLFTSGGDVALKGDGSIATKRY